MAAAGGRAQAVSGKLVARQPFAGYWEYLMEDALFVAPAHPSWGGAGLFGPDGKLVGVGSLILQQGEEGRRLDLNMVVPVHQLIPVLDHLITQGRRPSPPRPWLGLYATEDEEGISVASLAPNGPAEAAGLRNGDRIISVEGVELGELADFWRAIWAIGPAGSHVHVQVSRGKARREVTITSADRVQFLKRPRLH
jgi:S1-C subfamily serine protease